MIRFKLLILCLCFLNSGIYAQPSNSDYLIGYGGNILALGTEIFFKDNLAPVKPNWAEPNVFDLFFRDRLKWDNTDLERAALYSDILVRGITIPSIFWSSYDSGYKYSSYVLLQMQVVAATGLLTYMSKFIIGRQRPYSYFNTIDKKSAADNLSFFSGHSSFSFAIATSTGYLLEKNQPAYSGLIWSSGLLIASATAYLRIAGDRHYMSDILTGMFIGSAVGYLIAKNQRKKFFKKRLAHNPDFQINFIIPINN